MPLFSVCQKTGREQYKNCRTDDECATLFLSHIFSSSRMVLPAMLLETRESALFWVDSNISSDFLQRDTVKNRFYAVSLSVTGLPVPLFYDG